MLTIKRMTSLYFLLMEVWFFDDISVSEGLVSSHSKKKIKCPVDVETSPITKAVVGVIQPRIHL